MFSIYQNSDDNTWVEAPWDGSHSHDNVTVGAGDGGTTTSSAGAHTHTITIDPDGAHVHSTDVQSNGTHGHNLAGTTQSEAAHDHGAGTLSAELVSAHDHGVNDGAYTTSSSGAVPAHTHDLDFELDGDGSDGLSDESNYISSDGTITINGAGGHTHTMESDAAHSHGWSENTNSSTLSVGTSTTGVSASSTDTLAIGATELTSGKTNNETLDTGAELDNSHYSHNGSYVRMGASDFYQDYGGGSTWYSPLVTDDSEYDLSWDNLSASTWHFHDANHEHDSLINTNHDHSLTGSVTTTITEPNNGQGHGHTLVGEVFGTVAEVAGHTHDIHNVANHVHSASCSVDSAIKITERATSSDGSVAAHTHTISIEEQSAGEHGHTVSGTTASGGEHDHSLVGATASGAGLHSHTVTVNEGGGHDHDASSDLTGAHTHSIGAHDHAVGVHESVKVQHDSGDETYELRDDLAHGHYFDVQSNYNHSDSGDSDSNDAHLDHTHLIDELTSSDTASFAGSASTTATQELTTGSSGGNHSHGGKTGTFGSATPEKIEVVQPWIAINFIIKHD